MKKREIPAMNMGISLLILVFMNLCLVAFAVLSLQNAVTDYSLSEKTAEHTTQYYEGVNRMQAQIAQANQTLQGIWDDIAASDSGTNRKIKLYYKKVKETFPENYAAEDDERALCFTEEISEEQQLAVKLVLPDPQSGDFYRIGTWQLQSAGDWEADQSLDVYQGK